MCYTRRTSTCGKSGGVQCMPANVFGGSGNLAVSNVSSGHILSIGIDSLRHGVRFRFRIPRSEGVVYVCLPLIYCRKLCGEEMMASCLLFIDSLAASIVPTPTHRLTSYQHRDQEWAERDIGSNHITALRREEPAPPAFFPVAGRLKAGR